MTTATLKELRLFLSFNEYPSFDELTQPFQGCEIDLVPFRTQGSGEAPQPWAVIRERFQHSDCERPASS